MQSCGIYVQCSWTYLLCVEFLFQPSIWRVELVEDHPLHHGKFLYRQRHVIYEEMETFQVFLAESSRGCSRFVAHFFLLFCV